jgi:hypothetical protein
VKKIWQKIRVRKDTFFNPNVTKLHNTWYYCFVVIVDFVVLQTNQNFRKMIKGRKAQTNQNFRKIIKWIKESYVLIVNFQIPAVSWTSADSTHFLLILSL